ncbi:MAG TPA: FHA domain-containing protein [Ktedonobacteraceae bacterium]
MNVVNKSPGSGSIRFLTGPLAGSTLQINKPLTTIGREPTNDIVISDPSVSRLHARLVNNGGQWSIEKLAPQNVVTVNQHQVQQAVISDRDTIGLGTGTTFLFLIWPTQSPGDLRPAAPVPVQSTPQQQIPRPLPFSGQQPQVQQSFTEPFAPQLSGATQRAPTDVYLPGSTADSYSTPGIPTLEISTNIHAEKQSVPLTKQVFNIGRDPSNDIVINELVISAFHAQIVREGNQLVFIHPHPSRGKTLNGLLYQGRHIQGDERFRKPLTRGDIFRIGDEHGTLVTLTYNDGSGAAQDIVPEVRPIPLGAPVITIGRMPENMVVLSHPQVSGRHARLEQVQGGYRIIDVGSTNHVYVNAQRVTNQLLRPDDEIRIGPYKFTYTGTQLTQQDESNGIRIDALHLQKVGSKHTILINDISIAIPQRKFVALVGGSGAGKSTLMDALNGLRPAQQGLVMFNGQDYYRHLAAFSTQLGYVPQDDIIHRDLTVERALYYTARMRLPEDFTQTQIKQRIDEVLEDVEMKHRRGLLVSKLSGGQRKRVSIALELLANPSVFFLDEPTSGLDPGLDRKMMFLLRRLADKGHTIALVTHATNNINACDYICFLAQGGRLAYFGPPNDAKAYFGKTDFAEIYSALEPTEENPNIPAEAENRFKASPDYQKYVVAPLNQGPAGHANTSQQTVAVKPPKRGNPWKQFSLLSRRYLELLKNDRGNLFILLLQAPIIAAILVLMLSSGGHGTFDPSSVAKCPLNPPGTNIHIPQTVSNPFSCQNVVNFLNGTPEGQAYVATHGGDVARATQDFIAPESGFDAQKYLFIMAFAALMFGCINGAREIVKEAPIYRRERTVNLGIAPYMFSKIIVLGVLCLVQSAVLVLAVNWIAPIQQGILLPAPLEIYITMALTSLAGLMIGLTVSAIAPNNDRAVSFIPIILIPQVIFSGLLFNLNGPVLQAIGALFAVRWGMAASGSSVGIHGDKLGADDFSYRGTLFSIYSQTDALIHLFVCWLALVAMILLLSIATAYFLKRKDIRR